MLASILIAFLVLPHSSQDAQPAQLPPADYSPQSPFDHVVELVLTAEDEPIDGFGPAQWVDEEIAFQGGLHFWTESSPGIDIALRVESDAAEILAEDEDSGGGLTPFIRLEVESGTFVHIAVALRSEVAFKAPTTIRLHIVASPETETTREAAAQAELELEEIKRLRRAGELDSSRERMTALVELLLSTEGGESSFEISKILEESGIIASSLSILPTAGRALEAAHRQSQRLFPPDHFDLIAAKERLGGTRSRQGILTEELELYEYVHEARERLLPPDHPRLLDAKQNLAGAIGKHGNLQRSLELEEYVHAVRERMLSPDNPRLLVAKLNLAATRSQVRDLEGALELTEYVHAAWGRLLSPDDPDLLLVKGNLAVIRKGLGDVEGALELGEYVHAAYERLLPPDHPRFLRAKINLAGTRSSLGDLEGALELTEFVHAARERLLPPGHPLLLLAKQGLALIRRKLGDLEGALELAEYVHAVSERQLPSGHPDLLIAKLNLAGMRSESGDLEGGLKLFETVHTAMEQLFAPDHVRLLEAKQSLAVSCNRLGDIERLREILVSLLDSEVILAEGLQRLAPRLARSTALREFGRIEMGLYWSESLPPEEIAAVHAQLFRSLEGLRLASTTSPEIMRAARKLPELEQTLGLLERAGRRAAEVAQSPPHGEGGTSEEEVEAWRTRLVLAGEKRDALQREVRRKLEQDGLLTSVPTLDEIAGQLTKGEALVSYLRYKQYGEGDEVGTYTTTDSLLAFVLSSDGFVQRVNLGSIAELDELVSTWRRLIGKPIELANNPDAAPQRGVGLGTVSAQDDVVAGRALRARLIDPCLAVLAKDTIQRLIVIPDDLVYLVPLDALPGKEDQRLGDSLALRMINNVAPLVRKSPAPSGGTLVAFGDVDFGAEVIGDLGPDAVSASPPKPVHRSGTDFRPLLQTRFEVDAITSLFEELQGGKPELRKGVRASKGELVALAQQARYLHIATHAWFTPEHQAVSMWDTSTPGREELLRPSLGRSGDTLTGFLPETLCGLALSGANLHKKTGGRLSGILTAEELTNLDLSNCELAVLSACETNVGIRRAGQGIQSLQTSLQAAGVRVSITSLWSVDDEATRLLFDVFYVALWKDGLGPGQALWKAKLALRAKGHPVSDWAGWVLTGESR